MLKLLTTRPRLITSNLTKSIYAFRTITMATTDLSKIASTLLANGPHKHEPCPRLIRVLLNGSYIISTLSAQRVWEVPYYPQYYLPRGALSSDASLTNAREHADEGYTLYDIGTGSDGKTAPAVLLHKGPLAEYLRLDYKAVDGLFEEDDPIDGHPADPYKRIDTRRSSRPVKVEVDGVTVAESDWAVHLYEGSLPVRYYLPRTSAVWKQLRPSDTQTFCPYKGLASYFDIVVGDKVHKDLVWYYPNARLESLAVQHLLCFYNEKVDITMDGKKIERPKSMFA